MSEATGVNANDLQLERGRPQVLLHGKGLRDRVVPIPKDLVRSLTDLLSERGLANHGRVEDWRANRSLDRATFPAPSTSHAACGFPALRAPICFAPRLMGPIMLGLLSFRRAAPDSC
ncbi:hypothetical protein [Bradyrhizobium brasilense]|uniref:Uncharacterized protein n=1 Tax=Bradyrhizobium brasilense TaxID=1419277 RepID=A0ABY8JAP0_9BRAD|nr:hypothetical protein [Bradyrhizobium brasilense]WFU62556.1 hypothetical protein QA636_34585 [Bradyrhizobium brasilense]